VDQALVRRGAIAIRAGSDPIRQNDAQPIAEPLLRGLWQHP
jgi:hypothetical protein